MTATPYPPYELRFNQLSIHSQQKKFVEVEKNNFSSSDID
jgi:hypothetical protein